MRTRSGPGARAVALSLVPSPGTYWFEEGGHLIPREEEADAEQRRDSQPSQPLFGPNLNPFLGHMTRISPFSILRASNVSE